MTFYENFEAALKLKGMSPADICTKTGLYPAYFSKLKSGHSKDVTWERAVSIVHALGMTLDEFNELGNSEK